MFATPPAAVAGSISDGVWTHNHGPINCTFYGIHFTFSGTAYARTDDDNGGCASLKVRLKYKRSSDGAVFITPWKQETDDSVQVWGTYPGVAMSSRHQALNGWYGIWSVVREPHAW
jgi:hypothetical protein